MKRRSMTRAVLDATILRYWEPSWKDSKWKNWFTDLDSGSSAVPQNCLGKAVILRLRKEPGTILPKIPTQSNTVFQEARSIKEEIHLLLLKKKERVSLELGKNAPVTLARAVSLGVLSAMAGAGRGLNKRRKRWSAGDRCKLGCFVMTATEPNSK